MDLKATALKGITRATSLFLADLNALPADAFTKDFGGKSRTVADIAYEVNMVNDHIRMTLLNQNPPAWPDGGWITAPADFSTKETVIAAFENSSKLFVEMVNGFTVQDLEGTIIDEHGEKTRFQQIQFAGIHLWYHSGQLNFIQTLLGDDDWHWA